MPEWYHHSLYFMWQSEYQKYLFLPKSAPNPKKENKFVHSFLHSVHKNMTSNYKKIYKLGFIRLIVYIAFYLFILELQGIQTKGDKNFLICFQNI